VAAGTSIICWYSKDQQNTVEPSTYGLEFIAMNIAVESIEGLLSYKFRIMRVQVVVSCNFFFDNEVAAKNSTRLEELTSLKKKH
jgi:hypothetical protein